MPGFAVALSRSFGQPALPRWTPDLDPAGGGPVALGEKPPQVARLDAKQVGRLIVTTATPPDAPAAPGAASPEAERGRGVGLIPYDDFAKVELRVGVVRAARAVPKADKLLELQVDVGEGTPRTIVAGIALAYPDPQALVGKRIVVVANLEPRPLRGITSQGMLLAAGEAPALQLVTVGDAIAPGTRVK
jgi:methionyl-tRNA synthetase